MSATPHAPGVFIDLDTVSRREEILAYANDRGIGWAQAIVHLVNHALAIGPNPYHAALQSYAALHNVSEDEAYTAIWGDEL